LLIIILEIRSNWLNYVLNTL